MNTLSIVTTANLITHFELHHDDWVVADGGDQQALVRYREFMATGNFHPVVVDTHLLTHLGFTPAECQYEESEVEVYERDGFRISIITHEVYLFEGGSKGRIDVQHLHLLQQTWRAFAGEDFPVDLLQIPHTILAY